MKVLVSGIREIVVDHDVDALDIDTPSEKVGGHKNAVLEFLEGFELLDTGHKAAM